MFTNKISFDSEGYSFYDSSNIIKFSILFLCFVAFSFPTVVFSKTVHIASGTVTKVKRIVL